MTAGRSSAKADVVVVGGGVAGGALATALAGEGVSVLVLEQGEGYRDRVRGESIVPWGVKEAIRLDLTDVLLAAGAHWATRWVAYDEVVDPEQAESRALPLDSLLPGVPGSLNVGHPVACQALRTAALDAGAEYEMGVREVRVELGRAPAVAYHSNGTGRRVRCRLVVGADGRSSVVRRQIGARILRTQPPHLLSGLLVDELDGIDAGAEVQAVEDDIYFLGMPQGPHRARVYLGLELAGKRRFAGPRGADAFLAACRRRCMPPAESWASGVPIGPCATFTAEDLWLDSPVGEGAVLIGDAAGYVNPLIGQGLALALRDARFVRDVLLAGDWSEGAFAEYVRRRAEWLGKVRSVGRLYAAVFTDFSPGAPRRRRLVSEKIEEDPRIALPFAAMFAGPESIPSADFVDRIRERLLAAAAAEPAPAG